MSKKLILFSALLFSFGLAACGGDKDTNTTTNDVETETNTAVDRATGNDTTTDRATEKDSTTEQSGEVVSWQNQVGIIASNDVEASDKFYELETFLVNYKATPEELEHFKNDIISEYEAKRYLADLDNDEYMLSMLLKAYVVEQNNQGTPLGDFAFDMYQNLKYTYRGVDDINSESVISNEEQMNKALSEMK